MQYFCRQYVGTLAAIAVRRLYVPITGWAESCGIIRKYTTVCGGSADTLASSSSGGKPNQVDRLQPGFAIANVVFRHAKQKPLEA